MRRSWCVLILAVVLIIPATTQAQNQLQDMPGFDKYEAMNQAIRGQGLVTGGTISRILWSEDGNSLFYAKGEDHYRVNLRNLRITTGNTQSLH